MDTYISLNVIFLFIYYDFDKTSIENKKSNGQMRATDSGLLQRELR